MVLDLGLPLSVLFAVRVVVVVVERAFYVY